MGDMDKFCVVEIHEAIKNDCENRNRRRKLTLSMKRYSRKKACRDRRRRLALQNTSGSSTSDGQRQTLQKIILYFPLDEKIETSDSKVSEETTEESKCEIQETGNIEDCSNVETANEEFAIAKPEIKGFVTEKTVNNEPEEGSYVPSGLSIVDMQHIFAEFQKIGDHAKNEEDCGIRHLKITGTKRSCMRSTLSVVCEKCQYKGEIHSAPDKSD